MLFFKQWPVSYNTPYEKIGGEVRSLADEVPFDIPDSWEWVRLKDVAFTNGGFAFKSANFVDEGIRVIRISDFNENGFVDTKIVRHPYNDSLDRFLLNEKNILLCMTGGTVGKSYFVTSLKEQMVTNQRVATIKIFGALEEYVNLVILSPITQKVINDSKNSTNDNISIDTINGFFVPLPPIDEQRRIVDTIASVLQLIDKYEEKYSRFSRLQGAFPEVLKKSILQEAVQGKLVPQDPSDEPAEALLERIRAEKQRLIKEGKIKKDKHESVIFRRDNSHYEKRGSEEVCIDEEIPFEIPDNWAWARLSSFGVFSSGKTPSMSNPQFWNGSIPWVTSKDMKRPVITDSEMHISESAASTMQLYSAGTLLLVARSGILKRLLPLCKLGIDSTTNQDIKAFSLYDIELSEWLFYGIKAFEPYILKELVKSVTTVESLKFDEFSAMLIPVPPLSEQRRIIVAIKAAINLLTPLSSNPLFSL